MAHKSLIAYNPNPKHDVQLKPTELGCIDYTDDRLTFDGTYTPLSDMAHSLRKSEFTSKQMEKETLPADLRTKCPLSFTTSGSYDHNGGTLTSKDGDLKLTIPEGAVKYGDLVKLSIASDLYGPFVLPSNRQSDVVSPYYWIGVGGSYKFHKPVQVEFEHFAVISACNPLHYQLLCCEDDDESYTMRPVDRQLTFTVQDDISLCTFYTDHFCSYCLFPGCQDPIINRISAIYLKTKDYQYLTHFTAEIWFSFNINQCLKRNEELYTKQDMVLDQKCSYNFKAACNKNATSYFNLTYCKDINDWDVKHSRSERIETKEINFYNYYTDKEHLKRGEDNSLFPQRFILNVTKKKGCNTDLNTEMTVILYKNRKEIQESIPFPLFVQISTFVGMITNRLSLTDTVVQIRTANNTGTFLLGFIF